MPWAPYMSRMAAGSCSAITHLNAGTLTSVVTSQIPADMPARSIRSRACRHAGSSTVRGSIRRDAISSAVRTRCRVAASRSIASQRAWLSASRKWFPEASPVVVPRKLPVSDPP